MMTRSTAVRSSLALPIVLMMSQGAAADVSATQVWGDWKAYMEDIGFAVTGTETVQGDDIAVSDLTITMTEEQGGMVISTGPLTFEQSGGEVNVVLPDSMPVVMSTDAGADPWKMTFNLDQTGHSVTVSGDDNALTYALAAETLAMTLTELVTDGATYGQDNARIAVTATNMQNTTTMTMGDLRNYAQQGSVDALSYDVFLDNPVEQVKMSVKGETSDLVFDTTSDIPTTLAAGAELPAMLAAGFRVVGTYGFGPGNMDFSVEQPVDGTVAAATSSDGGTLTVGMARSNIRYGVAQNNMQVQLSSPTLPFPVAFSMVQAGFDLDMPVAAGEEPQDFAMAFNLTDFVMADLLWSLFDPTGQLPRDPATVDVDVTGTAKVLMDLINPAPAAPGEMPFEPQSVSIDKLLIDAVGARVEGTGDVTFDSSDLATYGGVPKPVGSLNIALAGGNALLDKLVAMGLLPEQQAMGARMMMGMFAVPGAEPDTLKSQIVFNEQGQVLANGQRIK